MKEKKNVVILGAGTAGTLMSNILGKNKNYNVTVIDKNTKHYYQPGLLFLPFGKYEEKDIVENGKKHVSKNVAYVNKGVDKIVPENNSLLFEDGNQINYDLLIIATGSKIDINETEGINSEEWGKSVHTFYEPEAAKALRESLKAFKEGTLLIHFTEMPIKCPVAPLEFSFLVDDFFKKKGVRDKITLKYVTPLDGAFTKPKASESLGHLLKEKNIEIVPDFGLEKVDPKEKKLISYDEREVYYDLLVTIPTNKGSDVIGRSGLGDELDFVPTDHNTLQSKAHKNIFVIGDATNVPASKAGSVAHFEAHTLVENISRYFEGKELEKSFDGHANCFIETGGGKALLIDFNYDVEPLEGRFPFRSIGPLTLLKESRLNHIGKLAFKWIYWNIIIKGRPIPFITNKLNLKGKKL
jgi:sulfide:quinone oxidoreductase